MYKIKYGLVTVVGLVSGKSDIDLQALRCDWYRLEFSDSELVRIVTSLAGRHPDIHPKVIAGVPIWTVCRDQTNSVVGSLGTTLGEMDIDIRVRRINLGAPVSRYIGA